MRVSTVGQNQLLLVDLLRIQASLAETQKQVSSGKKSTDFKGIAADVATLLGSKSVLSRTEQYLQSNKNLERALEVQNLSLQGLVDVAEELREAVLGAMSSGSGLALRTRIDDLYSTSVSLLNTRDGNRYIFSGSRTDTAPVSVTTPAALEALGAGNELNAFTNNSLKAQANVDDSLTITYGVLGTEIAEDLFEIMQDLMIYETANGFSDPLTTAQSAFLLGKVADLNTAFDTLNTAQAKNGSLMSTLEDVQRRHDEDRTFLKSFVGNIEDVDLAEAITRLNQQQIALEASFQVFATLNRITLLDFM